MNNATNLWCHYPFTAIQTNSLTATPCCAFKPKQRLLLDNYFENPELIDVRQKILNNIIPEQCSRCVESENITGHSFRTNANLYDRDLEKQNYSIHGNGDVHHLFLVAGNVCNLKCLPCYNGSFIRSTELHKLKLINKAPSYLDVDLDRLLDLNFSKVTITGGEPFYDKRVFIFLEKLVFLGRSKFINLDINTNLTNITDTMLDLLTNNFKTVLLKGSIDGTGVTNDYLRYPCKFEEIENAVDMILSRPKIEFCITTALSNLSLLHFYDLVKWGINKGIRNHYISSVQSPNELAIHNLPVKIKESLLHSYIDLKNNISIEYHNRTAKIIDACIEVCSNDINPDMKPLIEFLTKHDELRGTNFLSVFPELKEFV